MLAKYNLEDLHNIGQNTYKRADPIKLTFLDKFLGIFEMILRVILYGSILNVYKLFKQLFAIKSGKKNIAGQLALVTGGGNGVGKLIALELARNKCNVAIIDLDCVATNETVELIRSYGVKCNGYNIDVSDFNAIENVSKIIESELGPVDILINNAGVMPVISLLEGTSNDVERIIKINLLAHFWTVRTFLPGMIERGRGHIVAMCSYAGLISIWRSVAYTTTKFAVKGFMDSLHDDLIYERQDHNIKLTTVFPVFMNTRQDLMELVKSAVGDARRIPMVKTALVAKETVDGILYNKRYVAVPKYLTFLTTAFANLPTTFRDTYKKLSINMSRK